VCVCVTRRYCVKTAELAWFVFGTETSLGLSPVLLKRNWGGFLQK